MQRIYVHELLEPEVYLRGRPFLIKLFQPWIGPMTEQRVLQVTPAGMLYFADHGELWRDSEERRALPETAEDALKEAERFLAGICKDFQAAGSEDIRNALKECPVPANRVRIDAVALLHPQLGLIDHWLCRFAIQVGAFPWTRERHHDDEEEVEEYPFHHTDRSKPLRVHDALIEVRIGSKRADGYRIIGFNLRWRPIKTKGIKATELFPPDADESEDHDHVGTSDEQEPLLVYVLDADSQRYLAPYYLTPSGHHFGFQPASEYSLVLNAIQRDGQQRTDLFLDIAGGHPKREFVVHWSYWRPDTLVADGVTYVGVGPILPGGLAPAVYNVIADVIDKKTSQTKRHQQMVYARLSEAEAMSNIEV